jgi:hypothetical protein
MQIRLLGETMIIASIVLLFTFIFCGLYGLVGLHLLCRFTNTSYEQENNDPILIFWLGLMLICWLLLIFSFFINIGLLAFVILACLAVYIVIWQRSTIINFISKLPPLTLWYLPLIGIVILFFFYIISNLTLPMAYYDSGLYHIQNIKWLETYPLVPGLGNLHGRFAFNSSWLPLSAFFGFNYLFGFRFYILNIFIVLLSTLFFIRKINQLLKTKSTSNMLSLVVFLFSILQAYRSVNSTTPDIAINLLIWIVLILFIEKYERNSLEIWDIRSCIIFLLACFAFTIKISSMALFLLPLFMFIYSYKATHHSAWKCILIGSIFLFPWFVQNIIISGTLIYPVAFLQIPWLDWSIPRENITEMARIIHYWAILPFADIELVSSMSLLEWFPKWVNNRSIEELVFLVTNVFGVFFFTIYDGVILIRSKYMDKETLVFLSLDFYIFFALAYWLLSAPDPRFAFGLLVIGFFLFFVRILKPILKSNIVYKSILWISLIFLIFLAQQITTRPRLREFLLFPPEAIIGDTKILKIDETLTIYTPVEGDQCWDAPLPCAHLMFPGVTARGDDLSDGFRTVVKP